MVRLYRLTLNDLELVDSTGLTLDAVSLRLPEGAYTTLRTYDRERIVGLGGHLKRLVNSLTLVDKNRLLDLSAIRSALRAVLVREGLDAVRLRITTPFDTDQVFISVEPFEPFPEDFYIRGVRCATTRLVREMPKAKLTDFIVSSRATKAEMDPAIHEMLLVDAEERILEGLTSNFFSVLGGELRTAGEGVLEGVTRGFVLAEAGEIIPVRADAIHLRDLPCVTEAFITSSSRDVMPVVQIDDAVIGAGQPGPVTRALMARYRAYLEQVSELP